MMMTLMQTANHHLVSAVFPVKMLCLQVLLQISSETQIPTCLKRIANLSAFPVCVDLYFAESFYVNIFPAYG
jgi:hypothetical protein